LINERLSLNSKYPLIFAHRGANSFAPENSLAAFEKAKKLGCQGVELDVRMCASGEIVVFHDRLISRMTGEKGKIHKLKLSHLRNFKLMHPQLPNEKIPVLQEVLDLVGKEILINIDIKKSTFSQNQIEEKILKILADKNFEENIIISSFNPLVLKKIATLNPRLHTGFIFRNRSSMMILNGHPVKSLHARHSILNSRYLQNLSHRSQQVYAWTVDEVESMEKLINMKIDGIITNRPELLIELENKMYPPQSSS
jgi:glycerophosphoryl diester phosphodiesterase